MYFGTRLLLRTGTNLCLDVRQSILSLNATDHRIILSQTIAIKQNQPTTMRIEAHSKPDQSPTLESKPTLKPTLKPPRLQL
jgi:hypothetical protein